VESGSIIDTSNPEDRLISAVVDNNQRVLQDGDVAKAGYVLIALLAQELRDSKGRGLGSSRSGLIFRLLLSDPHVMIAQIAHALSRNVVASNEALSITLALLSVVFEAEDTHDLNIAPDDADIVWSQLPWLGAAVEPWDDSAGARHRWAERLGWPTSEMPELDETEADDSGSFDEVDSQPPIRPILVDDFDRQARLFKDVPKETIEAILDQTVGARTDLPLSVAAEWDAVIRNIGALVQGDGAQAVRSWSNEHAAVIHAALKHLETHPHVSVLSQYSVRAMTPQSTRNDQWFFHNVVALAVHLTDERDRGDTIAAALVDASVVAPQWVG
jgi:hypothetical protein